MLGHISHPPTWRSQLRAVLAIADKDVKLRVRYPLELLFWGLQPIIWLTPVYFLGQSFSSGGTQRGFAEFTGSGDYMSFILVGVVLSNYISAVFWGMGYALKREMDLGVLESNWLVPVPRPLFLAGQTVASLVLTTATSAAVLALASLLFGFHLSGNVGTALLAVLPVLIALYGFGFAFAGLVLLMRDANTLVDVSSYLVTTLSGSNFPVQSLPGLLLPIALALPVTYGNDALRGTLLNTRTILPLPTEMAISVGFMLVMTVLGAYVFDRVERHCKTLGNLALH